MAPPRKEVMIGEQILDRLDHIAWLLEILTLKLSNSPNELPQFLAREAKINPGPSYDIRSNGHAATQRGASPSQDDEEWEED